MSTTIWEVANPPVLTGKLPYSDLLQKILQLRGFHHSDEIQEFLFPSLDHLHDPFTMKGISEAVKRILVAVERKEIILIHGDYDVDGITGAAILTRALEKLNARVIAFLPERKRDGYGVSQEALKVAREKNASVFMTVDCGITAFEAIKTARAQGLDTIIIDHHRIHDGKMPDANIIINPLQSDCSYPFKELSAGGLAFKLAQGLLGRGAHELLDLVALSTVCDVAPLTGENRALVIGGLERLSERKQVGFKSLCEVSKLKKKRIAASDLGFVLGPRINATGRLSTPDRAFKLLTTHSTQEADELARALDQENLKRRKEDARVLKHALQVVEREINFNRDKVIVVAGEGWNAGVIGIVAQRLVEQFSRPAIVIAFDGETGKGSGRSVKGYHLFEGFRHCASTLEQFGGHELAAGLTIKKKNFKAFRVKLNEHAQSVPTEVFCRSVRVDLELSLQDLSPQFLKEMSLLEPFGAGNPRPVFLTRHVRTKRAPETLKNNCLRWWLTDGTMTFEANWRVKDSEAVLPEAESYSIVFSPKVRSWDGQDRVTLEIRDVKTDI